MTKPTTFLSVQAAKNLEQVKMTNNLPEGIAQKKYKTIQKVPQLQPPWFVKKLETL